MDWSDGFKAVRLLDKIGLDASKEDEGVMHILGETIDQFEQASLNAVILGTLQNLKGLNINPYATQ